MAKTFQATDLPGRADFFHDEATVLVGNALAATIDTGQIMNYFARQSASANGDSFTQSCFLRAGTYTLSIEGQTNTANGILDWYLDNVAAITGQDWYAAAQNKNVVKTGTITIATDGYHVLKAIVNGKNGSSSGYNIDLTRYWLRQAID